MKLTPLEVEFNTLMRSIYDRAKKECHYNAGYFLRMLGEHGGVKTAKILLDSPSVSEGFVVLWSKNRLDLTVEAQLLSNQRFYELFSMREIDTARRWLKEYQEKPPAPPA